jgi:hypothetical protein
MDRHPIVSACSVAVGVYCVVKLTHGALEKERQRLTQYRSAYPLHQNKKRTADGNSGGV